MRYSSPLLGWHTMGKAAYEANDALIDAAIWILEDLTIPAELQEYFLKITSLVFNLSDGSIYNTFQAPVHEGDRDKVTHSRPILNLTRRQTKRLQRAVGVRANHEVLKMMQSKLGLERKAA